MAKINKYKKRSRITNAKFRQILKLFCHTVELLSELTDLISRGVIDKGREIPLAPQVCCQRNRTQTFGKATSSEKGMANLIKEAVSGLAAKKAILFVSKSDVAMVKKVVAADKVLADMVTEVKETECSGGIIAEDTEGKTRIDNTYDTRLDILLPKLMPQVSAELFENL